ncbi:radical SAM protein [Selenomonas sp. AB3002]|uniref:radical SAM/SPASM domain-containing protein n=1 Tax=Selenomonas sp. AB3002 TaxID=1392502 RepID=UPI0004976003
MRISTYEIILPLVEGEKKIEDKALLVNGLYFSFDVVAKEEADKFVAGDFAALPIALREWLLGRGHLTRKSEAEEIADMKLLGRIHRMIPARAGLGVVIIPTYDCNFRCPYCFEQHRLKKGQEWLSSTMSHEMVEAVFAAIESYKARGYSLGYCTLYGGEPFLAENIHVLREIAGHAKKLGLTLDAITNGYDLEAYLDFMEEYDCKQLQVTVDGVGEVNDRRRIHKEGLPTYDRILSNVELALQRGISISLRVNVGRENISGMGALIEDLRGRGFMDREKERVAEEEKLRETGGKPERGRFSYYFKATNNDRHPENNITEQDIIDELMKNGFTAMEAIGLQSQYSGPEQVLGQIFAKKALPQPSPTFCGSEAGMLVIDPFGKLYPCWDVVAKEDTAVGFTDEQSGRFLMSLTKAKWRTRTSDILPACQSCPYVFICRGGCASRAFAEHGSYFREHCGEAKEIFAFVASRVAGEAWAKNHESELSLSLAGPLSRLTEAERKTLTESRSQKEIFTCLKAAGLWGESEQENS